MTPDSRTCASPVPFEISPLSSQPTEHKASTVLVTDPTRPTRIIPVIIWKLFNFIFIILDNLTEALLFLSHFVGDIHQVILKLFKNVYVLNCFNLIMRYVIITYFTYTYIPIFSAIACGVREWCGRKHHRSTMVPS